MTRSSATEDARPGPDIPPRSDRSAAAPGSAAPGSAIRRPAASEPAAPEPAEPRAPVGLYVHVPFCVSLCPYCDFPVLTGRATSGPTARIPAYLAGLHAELKLRADVFDAAFGAPGPARPALETVYLGGGTPSLLGPAAVGGILDHVARRFGIADGAEVTLEANPGPAERGDLAGFRAAGVTRLSLGAQSQHASELRTLGRRHAPSDVADAVVEARRAGFPSVSLDLLTDVPGQTVASWEATLRAVVTLGPDHSSAYALTLEDPDADGLTGPDGDHLPVRPGARRWRERARRAQDEDRSVTMDGITDRVLGAAGLERYELSNHARPGHASLHNRGYWLRRSIAAVGPGAHAFDGGRTRSWNAARLDGWLAALLPGPGLPGPGMPPRLPPGGATVLADADVRSEAAILGLRLAEGIDGAAMTDMLLAPGITWALDAGLMAEGADGRLRLTARGRLLSNEVFQRLLPASSGSD